MKGINKSFLSYVIVTMFVVSAAFVWAWINPTANPPGGGGAISVNSSGNVGIGTTAPGAKLEVVGTTKFGGIINVVSNKIINLGNPTAGTDAATKDYVDLKGAVGGASTRLWGEGRPGAATIGTGAGGKECDSSLNTSIKVSRSERGAHWDSAAGACPVGWWVCTEAERGTNVCDISNTNQMAYLNCNPDSGNDSNGQMQSGSTRHAWVANVAPALSSKWRGRVVSYDWTGGVVVPSNEPLCSVLPVWCCAYQ